LLARKIADDILGVPEVNLYLFMSIFILAFLTRIIRIPVEGFTEGLLASVSMPVTYVLAYYGRPVEYAFVKTKGGVVLNARSWAREYLAVVSSFIVGFLIFMAITSSFNILAYTLAYISVQAMRLMLALIIPALSRHVDVGDPAVVMITSLGVSLLSLAVLLLLIATIARIFPGAIEF
jgi:hypothetical protein